MKPSQILARLCKDEGLDGPTYTAPGKCKVEKCLFSAPSTITDEAGIWNSPSQLSPILKLISCCLHNKFQGYWLAYSVSQYFSVL